MTDTLEKIQQEERQLDRALEQIENEEKQLRQLTEAYEACFYTTASLYAEMAECFHKNDFGWYVSDQSEQLTQQKKLIFLELEEAQHQKHLQKALIEEEQNERFYQRKKWLAEKEEQTNEY